MEQTSISSKLCQPGLNLKPNLVRELPFEVMEIQIALMSSVYNLGFGYYLIWRSQLVVTSYKSEIPCHALFIKAKMFNTYRLMTSGTVQKLVLQILWGQWEVPPHNQIFWAWALWSNKQEEELTDRLSKLAKWGQVLNLPSLSNQEWFSRGWGTRNWFHFVILCWCFATSEQQLVNKHVYIATLQNKMLLASI